MKRYAGLLISVLVVFLDQLTKGWVLKNLIPYTPVKITSMFNLTLAFNSGSAFSFLSEAGDWHRWFFTGFSSLMSVGLLVWILKLPDRLTIKLVSLSLILGGALGNLTDRILLGHVVDFIQVYYRTYYWPAFNIADSAICVGAVLLVFGSRKADV